MYTIEKGIESPKKRTGPGKGRDRQYPFDVMDVGDSFEVPIDKGKSLSGAIRFFKLRKPEVKFTRRTDKETGNVRVWRVK